MKAEFVNSGKEARCVKVKRAQAAGRGFRRVPDRLENAGNGRRRNCKANTRIRGQRSFDYHHQRL